MSDPAANRTDWDTPEAWAEARRVADKAHIIYRDLLERKQLASKAGQYIVIDSEDASAYVIAQGAIEAEDRFRKEYPEASRKPAAFQIGFA